MKDKELRKLIGSRVKQRRLELNLTQPYVAEKMGVTASTILRYENGSIDNTKKMVLEGLSEALHLFCDIRLCQIQFQTALFYSAPYQLA